MLKKNILVTGASSGFGRAIVEYLSHQGYTVVGTSRNIEISEKNINFLKLNVDDDVSVREAVNRFIQEYDQIDVLINNAGFGVAGPIEETSIEEAKSQFETNFFGTFRMIKAILPHMRKRNKGLIINISSIGGMIGLPYQGFYCASKFALEGFTEALRMELTPFNINVTNINPGDFKTSFTQNRNIIKGLTGIYNQQFQSTLSIYEKDEQSGPDPQAVALLIEKLIRNEGKTKVRYVVGQFSQKLGLWLKSILPSVLFEKILLENYKIK